MWCQQIARWRPGNGGRWRRGKRGQYKRMIGESRPYLVAVSIKCLWQLVSSQRASLLLEIDLYSPFIRRILTNEPSPTTRSITTV